MNIVLYQPDIALNVGAIIRLCACFDAKLHLIEPCGFPFNIQKIKRSAMDYIDKITLKKHMSWESFIEFHTTQSGNLYLFSTKATKNYYETQYSHNDYLIFGSESNGVSKEVWNYIHDAFKIPLKNSCRSLNLSTSVAIIMGEFIRSDKA